MQLWIVIGVLWDFWDFCDFRTDYTPSSGVALWLKEYSSRLLNEASTILAL